MFSELYAAYDRVIASLPCRLVVLFDCHLRILDLKEPEVATTARMHRYTLHVA